MGKRDAGVGAREKGENAFSWDERKTKAFVICKEQLETLRISLQFSTPSWAQMETTCSGLAKPLPSSMLEKRFKATEPDKKDGVVLLCPLSLKIWGRIGEGSDGGRKRRKS